MKKKVLVLSIIGIFVISIAISFAYWQITLQQESMNVANSDCFEIEFLNGEEITLTEAYPMSDESGMSLTPFSFKITNKCDSYATYQINLETISHSNKMLPEKYLKVNLSEKEETKITSKLSSELEVETTLENATKAFKLNTGVLKPKEEKEFTMHLWMHSEVTASDTDSMNAIYNGKISVITSYMKTLLLTDTVKNMPVVTSGNGLYEVSHEDAEITYTSDTEAQENLKQTEYRYAGPNPNNYVRFNNELWRIIGLVNTPEGSRVKIIRDESIGNYSWDSSESSVNNGYGVNEWGQADLMNLLNNGPYYNRTSGICYNGVNNGTTTCDFSESGLLDESKNMIDTITWNTGNNGTIIGGSINTLSFYILERSNNFEKICNNANNCNDTEIRTPIWIGQIGLIYPSDYGYATSGGSTTTREVCLNKELYNWGDSAVNDCKNNNWLYDDINYQWTMTPNTYSVYANLAWCVNTDGYVSNHNFSYAYYAHASFPTVYLRTNIKVVEGNGTIATPYELSF